MIESIKCIKNLGPFKSIENVRLAKTTLIFAENGRGKTMLSEAFRSLATAKPDLVAGRKRLGADGVPVIVLEQSDGGQVLHWKPGGWQGGRPKMAVFNDGFVEANVYSGLEVTAAHRQGLHSVVVGEEGVRMAKAYADAQERAEDALKETTKASEKIKAAVRGVDDVDRFCDEPVPRDIDEQIKDNERQIVLATKASEIEKRPELSQLDPPELRVDELRELLRHGISQVTGEAVNRVKAHLDCLWERGEAWVNEGWIQAGRDGDCPYCGQPLSASTLVNEYAEYFEDAYTSFKERIATFRTRFGADNSEDRRRGFEKRAKMLADLRKDWVKDGLEAETGLKFKSSEIVENWQSFAAGASRALTQKAAAPLDLADLDDETENALRQLDRALAAVASENRHIPELNAKLRALKQSVDRLDLKELKKESVRLGCLKRRSAEEVEIACRRYIDSRNERKQAKVESDRLNRELVNYRKSIFQRYGDAVNRYLCEFGTGFKLAELIGTSRRGGGSSQYEISINGHGVEVASQSPPEGGPSFKNTLSGGDRTSLALAFFFASLERREDIKETIVVIDDPLSSLDYSRWQATATMMQRLERKGVRQLVVLSHDRSFLCRVERLLKEDSRCHLQIRSEGGSSEVLRWDVSEACLAEYESRALRLRRFCDGGVYNRSEIMMDIRIHIETFLLISIPGQYNRLQSMSKFLSRCREAIKDGDEILSEGRTQDLSEIVGYVDPEMHPDPFRSTTDRELLRWAQRALDFCRGHTPDPTSEPD